MYRISNLVLTAALLLASLTSGAQFTADDFIITVKTDNVSEGSSAANQYTIPAEGTYTVYYESMPAGITGSAPAFTGVSCTTCPPLQTITFPSVGIYKIGLRPAGTTPLWHFVNSIASDKLKILTIEQWGTAQWSTLNAMFNGCTNLTTLNATDKPDMSNSPNMGFMFYNCTNFTGGSSMNSWNTTAVTNMSGMFWGATVFNQDISGWNTSNVTDMGVMFRNAASFNKPLNKWNTSKVTQMHYMFDGAAKFNRPLNKWNTSAVQEMQGMFMNASGFNQPVDKWDLSALSSADYMFYNSGMDCSNYSNTLAGWANNGNTKSGVSFQSQNGRSYGSFGQYYRAQLINNKSWNINGDSPDNGCIRVPPAIIDPSGSNPVTGGIQQQYWTAPIQPLKFVKRHYEITPETNPASSTGRIRLYFTNQDFKDFNSQNPTPALLLPDKDDESTMEARKVNLLIEKHGGESIDGSGLPGTYPGTVETINPDDTDVFWDVDYNCWAVEFNVTGFSGFFVKTTSDVLPVDFGEINAAVKGSSLFVNWRTLSETNNSHFEIEASMDGKVFVKIGEVKSNAEDGTSASPISYQFSTTEQNARATAGLLAFAVIATVAAAGKNRKLSVYVAIAMLIAIAPVACRKNDSTDLTGNSQKLFIRIKQVDKDGTFKYSKTVQVVQE